MQSSKSSAPEICREIELTTLLESMPEGVLMVDAQARILDSNSAAERFTQRSRRELRGTLVGDLTKLVSIEGGGGTVEFPSDAAMRALTGEQIRNERRTFRSINGNGEPVEAMVSANPICDPEGRIIGALVVISDITELTQLQRRLSDTERHHAIGEMAAGLAHDFSNVLDTIGKAVAVLEMRQDAPPEKRIQYLQLMRNAVRRGAEIVARLRKYMRDGSSELATTDVRKVLDEAIELTRPMWEQARNIKVNRNLRPVGAIRGNAADLNRVFTNLIINGLESMPRGGELTLSCEQREGTVRVAVSDTGSGIPLEQQKKIFFPYFTTKAKGTGLGLSGAQRIVLAHGGHIRFRSEPGAGTRFIIELPVMEAQDMGTADGHDVPSRPTGNDGVSQAA
jgi:PAS domain S-box-containing protein